MRNSKSLQGSTTVASDLPEEEWLFVSVPDDEIKTCFLYELDREVAGKSKDVEDSLPIESWPYWYKLWKHEFKRPSDWQFPATPWQCIPQPIRADLVRQSSLWYQDVVAQRSKLDFPAFAVAILGDTSTEAVNLNARVNIARQLQEVPKDTETGPVPLAAIQNEAYPPGYVFGSFVVDLAAPAEEVCRQFARWLRDARKRDGFNWGSKARGGCHEWLNRLGALRLSNHLGSREALSELIESRIKKKLRVPYSSAAECYRASAKVRAFIDENYLGNSEMTRVLQWLGGH